jgi:murein DD-endopeptidase MepM/ murein hydrolase activator NlpD
VYADVGALIGKTITAEDAANISEIYYRVQNGLYTAQMPDSLEGGSNGTHARITEMTAGDKTDFVGGDFISPIPGSWQGLVSCEFGTGYAGHAGMDLAVPVGTEVRAIAAGKVLYTKMGTTGYGYHVVINHGGGIVTLYAHNSQILVSEGQTVAQGEVIALSGRTGRSTGPHVHLEVVVDGVPMNPRNYL